MAEIKARKTGSGRQPRAVEFQRYLEDIQGNLTSIIDAKKTARPSQRTDSLRDIVKLVTQDGAEIVAFYYAVMSGYFTNFTPAHRMEAAAQLADRGFGKPATSIDVDVTQHSEMATLSTQEIVALLKED